MTLLPKPILEQVFNKAAETYDSGALMFREIGDRLAERLDFVRLQPNSVLDLGAGTGYITELLTKRYPVADIYCLDFSIDMLRQLQKKRSALSICALAENLPLAKNSIDLIISNMMLPWCDHLESIFAEVYQILKPGGLFLFSTLGPDTLYELRNSSAHIDNLARIHSFIDMHEVGDALLSANFSDPVMDMEFLNLRYDKTRTLFSDLKATGSYNVQSERWGNLTGKKRMEQFIAIYEEFRDAEQKLPVTFEVIYGHAWKIPEQSSSEVIVPVSEIRRSGIIFTD